MSIHTSVESLTRLAQTIDSDLGEVDALPTGESASLIRVTRSGEIAVRSLAGDHPFDALLGFVAPEDWEVLGVIAPGWGTQPGDDGQPRRRRVRVIYMASRAGDEASLCRFAGDSAGTVMIPQERPVGRVADCVRRALNLPTADEPDESIGFLWAHRVLKSLSSRRHPSFGGGLVHEDEIEGIVAAAEPASWADERWAVVSGGDSLLMDGAIAAWMDDGMYARYVLADVRDHEGTMDSAKVACTPAAWRAALIALTAIMLGTEE